jgi:D-sedoheptulose 7-phosphate isomerase
MLEDKFMEINDFAKNYLGDLKELINTIDINEITEFIKDIENAYKNGKTIFIMGNGGSAATASHFVCDINKGVSLKLQKKFKVLCLNDNIPIMLAYSNDISYDSVFIEQLKNFIMNDDLVIGISGSGNSKNVLNAIEYSNKVGARTFGIIGCDGGKLKDIAQKSLIVRSFDMQKIEDCHMILTHLTMQYFSKKYTKEMIIT